MFKLIAIQTLTSDDKRYVVSDGASQEERFEADLRKSRKDSVMKVLHEREMYWLNRGYQLEEGEQKDEEQQEDKQQKQIQKEDKQQMKRIGGALYDSFYSNTQPTISISAIVGKNGMGKSSLLELLFRLINNVSYVLREALEVQKYALHFVRDIYARAWIEDDDAIYYIQQRDDQIKIHWQDQSHKDYIYRLGDNELPAQEARVVLKQLFYTIVVNYSQYAYNTNDYMSEWDDGDTNGESADTLCWLSSLFHKNDAYQTPIVLNPFRESGNINVNREKDLTQTRLYNLVLNDASPLKQILAKKEANAFVFDIETDLNPMPRHRYHSHKVVKQISLMRMLKVNNDYKTVNDIGRRITAAWGHVLGYKIESEDYWSNMDDVRTINYIVYKTLKISRNYAKYYDYHDCFGDAKNVLKYVAELNKDTSHITLKLRRCLAFLYYHHYSTGKVINGRVTENTVAIEDYKEAIERCMKEEDEILSRLIKERYISYYYGDEINPHIWQEDELMPAPSFKTDIILEGESQEKVRFSSLSSGEKQMIFSVSTVLYQLLNIESTWSINDKDRVSYKNVSLVFDEIELYSHPKYQLKLIDLLVKSIRSLGLNHVKNVNMIFATHSPFVLSDIAKQNVLYLEDGHDVGCKIRFSPFAANVNDTLHQSFFLNEGFLGAFVSEKISTLCDYLQGEQPTEEWDDDKADAFIEEVGDPLIKEQLLTLFLKKRFGNDYMSELTWLRKRVKQLENHHA